MKYENSSNLLQTKISSAKANYESDLITSFANNNNSKVYKYIRSLTKFHTISPTLHHGSIVADSDADKANIFNDYYFLLRLQLICHCLLKIQVIFRTLILLKKMFLIL